MSDRRYRDADWLREQYVEEGLSTYEIAKKSECSQRTVSRWLQKHGVETRETNPTQDRRFENAEWMREQYVEEGLSTTEIAEKSECSQTTVHRWLQKHGVETRTPGTQVGGKCQNAEWMREQYVEKELSSYEIAEKCGCSQRTVHRWLQKHGVKTRSPSEALSGENNPHWNGGGTPYGPGWNESKRQHVRERDNYTCQAPDCDTTQSEHRDRHGEKLHVHHLRKARDIDDPEERNAAENLVTLCRDCHQRWEKVADAGLVPQFTSVADD